MGDDNIESDLDMHLEQLRSLRSGHETLRTAAPPAEFDVYELVLLRRPEVRPEIAEEEADLLQRQHLGHFANMTGWVPEVVGPLGDNPTTAGVGSASTRSAHWRRRPPGRDGPRRTCWPTLHRSHALVHGQRCPRSGAS